MTKRRKEVFDWIFEYIRNNGQEPRARDICKQFNITSCTQYIKQLQRICAHYKIKNYEDWIKFTKTLDIEDHWRDRRINVLYKDKTND